MRLTINESLSIISHFIVILSISPNLYDGDLDYEKRYLSRYTRSPRSLLAILEDNQGLVGVCTAIPLKDEDPEFQQPFQQERIEDIFYIGEILLRPNARGQGLGSVLLSRVIQLIETAGYPRIVLCAVDRGTDHPLRPENYVPPDALWRKFGFIQDAKRIAYYHWRDLGEQVETAKPMNFWVRRFVAINDSLGSLGTA